MKLSFKQMSISLHQYVFRLQFSTLNDTNVWNNWEHYSWW